MIVWKETKLKVRVVQPRRVACTHCPEAFVYLATDTFEKVVRGLPYVSVVAGADGRRERLLAAAEEELRTRSLNEKGEAVCPHCRHQLPWMELDRLQSVLGTGFVLLIVGGVVTWLLGALLGWTDAIVIAYGAAGGAVLGGLIGAKTDVTPKPSDNAEHSVRAMTDDRWADFANATLRVGIDPAELWWQNIRKHADDAAVVGMPLADETRGAAAGSAPIGA